LLSPAPQAGASAKFRHLGDFDLWFTIFYLLFNTHDLLFIIVPAFTGISTLFINSRYLSILNSEIEEIGADYRRQQQRIQTAAPKV
jgi:hypothetical protein